MKSLEEQIKFIDTKLLPLFGFVNIIDYNKIICIGDPDSVPIDKAKFNELIPEFRKTFHAKNFNLHKTQYKIISNNQAICILKICLENTSVPYDIFLKNKKRCLRLISKNNVLDNYINTLKMSGIGTFEEKKINIIEEKKINIIEEKKINEQDNYLNTLGMLQEKNKITNSEEKKNNKIYFGNSDDNNDYVGTGYKKYVEPEFINKEVLNNGIKKTNTMELFLSPTRLTGYDQSNFDLTEILQINLKNYGLSGLTIKSFGIKIQSKKHNGINILTDSFVEYAVSIITYKLVIGGGLIYTENFIQDKNLLIDGIILPLKCLYHHTVNINLYNIKNIRNILECLEIKLTVEHVDFYNELELKLSTCGIEQFNTNTNNLCNVLRIMDGMGGNSYYEYIEYDKYIQLTNGFIDYKNGISVKVGNWNNSVIVPDKLSNEEILSDKRLSGTIVSLNGISGFAVDKIINTMIEKDTIMQIPIEYYNFDYSMSKVNCELEHNFISYSKIKIKNKYIHKYDIPIGLTIDTINELNILIPNLNTFVSESLIELKLVNYNNFIQDTELKFSILDQVIKVDIGTKHIATVCTLKHILLVISSDSIENEPINEKIILMYNAYCWNTKYRRYFAQLANKIPEIIKLN